MKFVIFIQVVLRQSLILLHNTGNNAVTLAKICATARGAIAVLATSNESTEVTFNREEGDYS